MRSPLVVARLAQGELDVAGACRRRGRGGAQPRMSPASMNARSSSRPPTNWRLRAVAAVGPLDRELDVVGDELERGVRVGPVEGREVALEEAHAAALARPVASGAHADQREAAVGEERPRRGSARRSRSGGTSARCCCRGRGSRASSSRGSLLGIAPCAHRVRRGSWPRRTRGRACATRAAWRASSSRGEPLRRDSSPCSATSTRLRWTSCSERSKQSSMTATSACERVGAVGASAAAKRDAEALDRLVHDHVEAVLLGLEVVVERGRARRRRRRRCRPTWCPRSRRGRSAPSPRRGSPCACALDPRTSAARAGPFGSDWC